MAEAFAEAVPAYGEDLQKRVSIPPQSSTQITSPQTSLSVITATNPQQQSTSSEPATGYLKKTGKSFLAPRPSCPMTLKSSPSMNTQEPENYRNFEKHPTPFYSCASGIGPSTSATPEYTSMGVKQSSKTYGRHARAKRKREGHDSGSDDMSDRPEKSLKKKICNTPGPTPKLACPFFVRCPRKYLRCGFSSFGKVSHVAQHLERQHYENVEYDCPICGDDFDTLNSRDAHVRERRCTERNTGLRAVTTERLDVIRFISADRLKKQREKWGEIYKTIAGDSIPAPLPWCTDPVGYLLFHFINIESRSGDRSIFNLGEDFETHIIRAVNNYLADEQEPLESSSMLQPSLLDSNFPEYSVPGSTSSILESSSVNPFQLHRPTVATPVSTIPESHEANMTNPELISDQAHELGQDDVTSYALDLDGSLTGFFGFSGQHDGSLT
ncbi:hypothetical protein F4680DRAFT_114216 [Xylaria scruposa]|nr:hypothetical protein F4680DRAFT_114216 [Xylaria scruposa]